MPQALSTCLLYPIPHFSPASSRVSALLFHAHLCADAFCKQAGSGRKASLHLRRPRSCHDVARCHVPPVMHNTGHNTALHANGPPLAEVRRASYACHMADAMWSTRLRAVRAHGPDPFLHVSDSHPLLPCHAPAVPADAPAGCPGQRVQQLPHKDHSCLAEGGPAAHVQCLWAAARPGSPGSCHVACPPAGGPPSALLACLHCSTLLLQHYLMHNQAALGQLEGPCWVLDTAQA